MFPFGSFTSEIPLFALAFAYMLFFGTYALNKTKANNKADIIQEKEQHVKYSFDEHLGKTFYYHQSSVKEKAASCSDNYEADIFPDQFNSSLGYIPDRKISIQFYEISLFSRPPPFLA